MAKNGPNWAQNRRNSAEMAQIRPKYAQIGPKWPKYNGFCGRTYVRTDVLTFLTLTQVEPENWKVLQ